MKRNVMAILVAVLMLVMMPVAAMAHTYNDAEITFAEWSNAAFGGWEQKEDGTLVPTELTDFTLLRLDKDLGDEYTVEFDVKQDDLNSGWQTIQIGFEVNAGENFTQSGFTLDMHNAGVARVIEFSKANAGASVLGSYDNTYGQIGYVPNTEWRHIKIQRAGSNFTITIDNDTNAVISFTCDTVSGGHLVLGAVGGRMVSYRNVVVTDGNKTAEPPVVNPGTGDAMEFAVLGAVMIVSLAAVAGMTLRKKESI